MDPQLAVGRVLEHLRAGRFHEAERLAGELIVDDPASSDGWHLRAMARRELGRYQDASADLQECVRCEPGNSVAWLHLGQLRARLNDRAAACDAFSRAAHLDPNNAHAWLQHGRCELDDGRFRGAAEALRRAAAAAPGVALVQALLALALVRSGAPVEGLGALQRVPAGGAHDGETLFQLARAHAALGWFSQAEDLYRRALDRADVNRVAVLHNLGMLLTEAGRRAEASSAFEESVRLDADNWRSLAMLAHLRLEHGDPSAVRAVAERLSAAFASLPSAVYAAGELWEALGEQGRAFAAFERAIELGDDSATTRRTRFRTARALCDWRWFDADRDWTIAHLAEGYDDERDTFALLSVPGVGEDLLLRRARQVGARLARIGREAGLPRRSPQAPNGGRLRIGYLSADFRVHPMAYLMAGVFETHDRGRLEVSGYSLARDDRSEIRRRIEAGFEHFVDVSQADDRTIAKRIAADGVDLLVDLSGYTQGTRPAALAYRPAPVQMSYLGYPGTLGAPYVDYILADEVVLPTESFRHYVERVAWIPGCYQANDRSRKVGPASTRAAHGLPDDGLVLCCFNGAQKITPTIFDIWCRLLIDVPGSVLWLYAGKFAEVRDNLRAEARRRGVDPARLVFAGSLPNPEHLARVALADLFLDTLPYNAHTTGSDALWVGVPVLTCKGDTFAGRVGASLLQAVGLPELVAESLPEYEAKARHLLTHPDELARLKGHLLAQRLSCRLFDTEGFTRDLEALYLAMWERHQAGLPPAALRLEAAGSAVWSD